MLSRILSNAMRHNEKRGGGEEEFGAKGRSTKAEEKKE